jgi:glycogen/starch synthases, ADP-glucose type
MHIVHIASECAPVAKVGGLGDVVYGLAGELARHGHQVEIILPRYDCLRHDHIANLHIVFHDLGVPWHGGLVRCTVWYGDVHGRHCFFIESHSDDRFFDRGSYYGFWDDTTRMAFFSKAALEFLRQSGKRPDVIHCHDWQTGLVPVLLYEQYQDDMPNQRVCFTIHNFKHQGTADDHPLNATGLGRPEYFLRQDKLGDDHKHDQINMMKGGIVYANFVTTVSPHHAWEARNADVGFGMGHTLYRHQDKFKGILNGLDYDYWNPESDSHLSAHYGRSSLKNKDKARKALRHRLWLRESKKPIVAYVGRLDAQKGVHLIRHALFYALANDAQFVLLGSSPELGINDYFGHLKQELNDNPDCHLEIGFDEDLAHQIYAGADIFIVPSNFEPCGLTQLIALRYGTVPVVRSVGGLKDTVFDRDHDHRPMAERNGFVFEHSDPPGLESALSRALQLWHHHPAAFRELQSQGMAWDYSWKHPGEEYLRVYEFIRHK